MDSGIPTIYYELANAKMAPPKFSVRRGEFVVTFMSKIAAAYEIPQVKPLEVHEAIAPYGARGAQEKLEPAIKEDASEQKLLEFCRKPRSRQEIIDFLGFSRYYAMSKIVQPLLDKGKLALTLPDKPKSSKQRYYTLLKL